MYPLSPQLVLNLALLQVREDFQQAVYNAGERWRESMSSTRFSSENEMLQMMRSYQRGCCTPNAEKDNSRKMQAVAASWSTRDTVGRETETLNLLWCSGWMLNANCSSRKLRLRETCVMSSQNFVLALYVSANRGYTFAFGQSKCHVATLHCHVINLKQTTIFFLTLTNTELSTRRIILHQQLFAAVHIMSHV